MEIKTNTGCCIQLCCTVTHIQLFCFWNNVLEIIYLKPNIGLDTINYLINNN